MPFILPLLGTLAYFASAQAAETWPIPDWSSAPASMESSQCQDFRDLAVGSKKFLTEGLVVVKDGQIQYEYYDSKYSAAQPHSMWSVSKTITGALLGIAVRDGKVSFGQPLTDFYPNPGAPSPYDQIHLSNLLYMDTGFVWNETYVGDTRLSPVLGMLYGSGRDDMAAYAAARPTIAQGPGHEWNYSTGTPTLTMGVLKKVYGADYDQMPWDKLFGPLGMKSAVFERDPSGTFVGGAYAFVSPRDMARLGYLFLNGGKWDGQTILTDDWMQKMLTVSPGYVSEGTVVQDTSDTGVYGGSLWLNRAAKPGLGRPYPASPEDMFLAVGHYGQFIIVLPSQGMVIARTGYDVEYASKIDEFTTRAIGCFADPNYPVGQTLPPPAKAKVSLKQDIETLETGLRSEIYEAAVAQAVCSCHFVSGLDLKTCIARSNIPAVKAMAHAKLEVDAADDSSSWLGRILSFHFGKKVRALYDASHPEYGCELN